MLFYLRMMKVDIYILDTIKFHKIKNESILV